MNGRFHGAARPATLLTVAMISFCGCKGGDGGDTVPPPAATAPVATATVIRSFPHDTSAFTQGLLWHDGTLYESTGRNGLSTLRQVQLETGKVLKQVKVPEQFFAEGLALFNGKLYQLTWQAQSGFIYDLADFRETGTFQYTGEGWGLTTDGKSLILSDGSSELRWLDPATFREQRNVTVMDGSEYINELNELEWVKGEVWANVWHKNQIARIDPQTGKVKGWIDLTGILTPPPADPEAVLNGIAYDEADNRLFVTGKLWPALFEISVPGVAGGGTGGAAAASGPAAVKPAAAAARTDSPGSTSKP